MISRVFSRFLLPSFLTSRIVKRFSGCAQSVQFHPCQRQFHSRPQTTQLSEMKIRAIPALQDNYMYLLIDEATNICAAVDPVEPKNLLVAVEEERVKLTTVLTTHHHWDHAGGNVELCKLMPGLTVYGGDDRIGALTNHVKHGDVLKLVYFGHEYTVSALQYARHVEPDNLDLKEYAEWAQSQRSKGLMTIPTTIGREKKVNPFMRVQCKSVQRHAKGETDPDKVMGFIRSEKDNFKAT